MTLEFDIPRSPPPTKEEIAARRAQGEAQRERLRQLNIRFLIFTIVIVLSVLSFVLFVAAPAVGRPEANQDLVFVATYILPYLFFVIFVVGNRLHINKVEKPRKALNAAMAGLEEIPREEWERLMEEWSQHKDVAEYCQRITAMGRSLLKAEREAIEKWLAKQAQQAGEAA